MKHLQHLTRAEAVNEDNAEQSAFNFPQGMAGFPGARQFAFIYSGQGDVTCLQSIECPELAFLLTPWDEQRLGSPPQLGQERRACLQLAETEEPFWMLVLNPFADAQWVTANLQAPIAINPEERIGLQCIRNEDQLELRYRWMPQAEKAA